MEACASDVSNQCTVTDTSTLSEHIKVRTCWSCDDESFQHESATSLFCGLVACLTNLWTHLAIQHQGLQMLELWETLWNGSDSWSADLATPVSKAENWTPWGIWVSQHVTTRILSIRFCFWIHAQTMCWDRWFRIDQVRYSTIRMLGKRNTRFRDVQSLVSKSY